MGLATIDLINKLLQLEKTLRNHQEAQNFEKVKYRLYYETICITRDVSLIAIAAATVGVNHPSYFHKVPSRFAFTLSVVLLAFARIFDAEPLKKRADHYAYNVDQYARLLEVSCFCLGVI